MCLTTVAGIAVLHAVQRVRLLFCALQCGHVQYSTWLFDSNMHTTSSDRSPSRGRWITLEKKFPTGRTSSHSPLDGHFEKDMGRLYCAFTAMMSSSSLAYSPFGGFFATSDWFQHAMKRSLSLLAMAVSLNGVNASWKWCSAWYRWRSG